MGDMYIRMGGATQCRIQVVQRHGACIYRGPLLIAAVRTDSGVFEYEWNMKGLGIEMKGELLVLLFH
jgi:hypothetical protein